MQVHSYLFVYFKPKFSDPWGGGDVSELCGEVALIKIKNRISLMQDMLRLAQNRKN